jgi:membrane glycosyltransferase
MVTGILIGVLAFLITMKTFLWLSPIVLGLGLSAPVSWATGLVALGQRAWAWNVFRIPEEVQAVHGDRDGAKPEGRLAAAE